MPEKRAPAARPFVVPKNSVRKQQPVECVLLPRPSSDAARLHHCLERPGLHVHLAESFGTARVLMALTCARVILAEPDSAEPLWFSEIYRLTQFGTEGVWIALLPEFDSDYWIDLLERGAYDIICGPYESASVAQIVSRADDHLQRIASSRSAIRGGPGRGSVFQFRNLHLFRPKRPQ